MSVEHGVDGIGIGGLDSCIRLKTKPGRVFLIDIEIDSSRLHLFVISAGMRNTLTICATVSIIRTCGRRSTPIEWTAKHCEWCSVGISIE